MAGAIVQSQIAEGAAGATTIASGTLGSNVTVNNYLWIITNSDTADTVTITKNGGTATIGTVTDRGSVTEAGTFEELTHFTVPITGSGTLDILATFGSSQANRQIVVVEVSGVNAVDVETEATDTGDNPTPTTPMSVTVTAQPGIGLAFCNLLQGSTPTAAGSWTSSAVLGSTVHIGRLVYQAVTATGALTCEFGNAGLDRANMAMIVFTDGSAGPTISGQPTSQTIYDGESATFTVTATGNGTLSYQWKRNGSNVGTDSSSYNTGAMTTANNGQTVSVDVTDNDGTVSSATVYLFVIGAGRMAWIRA